MFNEWKTNRELRKAVVQADSQLRRRYESGERDTERLMELLREKQYRESQLSQFESNQLVNKAEQYGIEIPNTESWWSDDSASGLPPEDVSRYLTQLGRVNVRKLIRTERRQNFEWWFTKVILPTLQTLIPILSLLVALVTVWKR